MANESTVVAIENANRSSGTTVRKNYTEAALAGEQSGHEMSKLLDEHPDERWRAPAADVGYSTALIRWAEARRVGFGALYGHNLSPSATWRMVLDDSYSVRPCLITDGVDDHGISGETVTTTPNLSLLARVYLPPPSIDQEATNVGIINVRNTANGERLRISIRRYSGASAGQIFVESPNFGGAFVTIDAGVITLGAWFDLGYRYRTSDNRFELWINGELKGFATATRTVTGSEGNSALTISTIIGTQHLPARYQNIAIYDSYLPDSDMTSYPHHVLSGSERGLVDAVHFTEGSGSSAVSVKGTTTITLTGGTWGDVANPFPSYSTGILEAIGQWYRRRALRISTGTSVATTSAIAVAPRDLTMSCLLEVLDDFSAGTDAEVFAYGPSYANAEGVFRIDSSGQVVITSNRGTPDTVTSSTIRGSGVVRARLVLQSINSTASNLSLYLGTGTSAESLVGMVTVGPYDAVALCKILIGDVGAGSDNSHVRLGGLRVFGAIRLEADDDLLGPCNLADPDLIESLVLDGSVVSQAVPSRSYTVNAATYETITNPNPTRRVVGRPGLGEPSNDEDAPIIAEMPWLIPGADIEAKELFIQFWDAENPDGWIEVGGCIPFATFRPDVNRVYGARRGWEPRKALRSTDGIPYRDNGFEAPIARVKFKNLERNEEDIELLRRLLRRRRDLLCAIVTDARLEPGVPMPQWLLQEFYVLGTLEDADEIEDANLAWSELNLRFRGLPPRRPS